MTANNCKAGLSFIFIFYFQSTNIAVTKTKEQSFNCTKIWLRINQYFQNYLTY